jgi:nucleoside-diphosphate-sugar epimerase
VKPYEFTDSELFEFRAKGRKTRHLVTGALGHIGSYIVQHLSHLPNVSVLAIDNGYNSNLSNIEDTRIDAHPTQTSSEVKWDANVNIANPDRILMLLDEFDPDYVYHQASMLTIDSSADPDEAYHVNTYGFWLLANWCAENGKKFVYASSASVYGNPQQVPTPETHGYHNHYRTYGCTKMANEYLARGLIEDSGAQIVGLRYFNVYGYRQSMKNMYVQILPLMIKSLFKGEPLQLLSNGSQTMDMVHGYDVGLANVLVMGNPELTRGFFNVGSGIETSVKQLHELVKANMPLYDDTVLYGSRDEDTILRRCADVTLMHENIMRHTVSVEEGVAHTVERLLNDQTRFPK